MPTTGGKPVELAPQLEADGYDVQHAPSRWRATPWRRKRDDGHGSSRRVGLHEQRGTVPWPLSVESTVAPRGRRTVPTAIDGQPRELQRGPAFELQAHEVAARRPSACRCRRSTARRRPSVETGTITASVSPAFSSSPLRRAMTRRTVPSIGAVTRWVRCRARRTSSFASSARALADIAAAGRPGWARASSTRVVGVGARCAAARRLERRLLRCARR